VGGEACIDLAYEEDRSADVDANVVMIEPDRFVEVQGTSEGEPFDRPALNRMLDLAQTAIRQLFALQHSALGR
jgi:ribonuclease PH